MTEEQPDSTAMAVREELASREREMHIPVRPGVWWALGIASVLGLVLVSLMIR